MNTATLHLELLSATTFGRGDGVAGEVDGEIEHDAQGLPYLRGRTLKGLLAEAAAEVAFALDGAGDDSWARCRDNLFGRPGSGLQSRGVVRVGDAQLPAPVRTWLHEALSGDNPRLSKDEVFSSLTGLRRQTAINEQGAPDKGSLRSYRVMVRGVRLTAELAFARALQPTEEALLSGAALALRAAGTSRNRGRGRVRVTLNSDEWMAGKLAYLEA